MTPAKHIKYAVLASCSVVFFSLYTDGLAQMDGFNRATEKELRADGWDSSKFKNAHSHADTTGTASYLLIKDGKIIDMYGDITHKYRSHSVRKSYLSALYGIYLNEGVIDTGKTLYQMGITEYVELTPQEQMATVRELIMARSGVYLPATYENKAFDKVRPARGSFEPGEYWYYSNWDFNTAGVVFMLQTGINIFDAFKRKIADPIGMQDFDLDDCIWRYSSRSIHPAYLFRMSTRDMARFGLLYLHEGEWNNEQIIPKRWIQESTAFHSNVVRPDRSPMPGVGYGYMWWTKKQYFEEAGLDIKGAYNASGTGTQGIYIMPKQNIIFVHRVNTDLPSDEYQSVNSKQIGDLLALILEAKM